MPTPSALRDPQHAVEVQAGVSLPSPGSPTGFDLLHGPDPSIHMIGEPRSYPRLGRWITLAVLGGAIVAFLLVLISGG